ncbi:GNAT family N-acetyltransferase [Halalkalibacter alkalisediminis]|uniref:GNAT family N-acetyltransferase n=1 Tax=Halalkalibacter alkalisediminis TaxID=935616 RepID=A0ABV6NI84_9BACI|nr:GNAT family N-acetyltransferase [Halalkalibacter alkalisediminis]
MNIKLEPLSVECTKKLFIFEKENRTFFETMVPSRGEDYYQYDRFLQSLNELLVEQERGEGNYFLIVNEVGVIVGRINLFNVRKHPSFSADLGYRVGKKYLRRGIASISLELLLGKVIVEHKKAEIRAKTTSHNIGSQKILEKHQFVRRVVKEKGVELNGHLFDFLEYYWKNY